MASATGIPEEDPTTIEAREDQPLLGRPGDVVQGNRAPIYYNLITGTSVVLNPEILWLHLDSS